VRKGPREEEIARARATLKQTEAAAQAAQQQADLVRAGARTGQIQTAAAQERESQAALRQAQAGQGQVAVAQTEAAAARASLAAAQAQVDAAKANLAKFRVTAPTDGLVDDTHVRVGEVVKPGTSLVTMVDFTDTYVTVYVPEPELPRVKLEQSAQVSVDGQPGQSFTGKVRRISQQAEFTPKYVQTTQERTRTVFAVEIALENKEGVLKPGMPADARIETGEQSARGPGGGK
jgi:HlyD family secretion protein